jgi:hypothetical protein
MAMPASLDIRLPGVYFLPPPQPAAQGLPSLDVAAFVGFAERGPLDLPVAVEDFNTYQAIFGGDFPLAREVSFGSDARPNSSPPAAGSQPLKPDDGGRMVYANLGSSVAGFFANGGSRCYVVRVAGKQAASTRFRVPGIVALSTDGDVKLSSLAASSPGRWSAGLRLGTRLQVTPLPVATLPVRTFQVKDPLHLIWQTGSAPQAVQAGDLLRLKFEDGQQWLFPVTDVESSVAAMPEVVLATNEVWELISSLPASPPLPVQRVFRLTLDGLEPFDAGGPLAITGDLVIILAGGYPSPVRTGDVLLLEMSNGSTYLFPVAAVNPSVDPASPPSMEVEATARVLLRLNTQASLGRLPILSLSQVDRLRFDLLLREEDVRRPTVSDLAFNAGHPRFWGEVVFVESSPLKRRSSASSTPPPSQPRVKTTKPDVSPAAQAAQLFRELQAGKRVEQAQDGTLDALTWAALLAPVDADPALTWLPLDMLWVISDDDLIGPNAGQVGDDDLDTFGAMPFLDEAIVRENMYSFPSSSALMAAALDRYYGQNIRLRGLHSLMFEDEVALVCVSDAVHRGWERHAAAQVPILSSAGAPPPALEPCPPVGPFADCLQPPNVANVDPASGPTSGGTRVTVTGTGFTVENGTIVNFDKSPARDVRVISTTKLSCESPAAGLAGAVKVEVVNAKGSGSKANAFTYVEQPTEPALPDLTSVDDFDPQPLLIIHRALIGFCQARADVVGILTLPLHFEKRQCIEWQETLRQNLGLPRRGSLFDDVRDIADLSYVAVYHPWLLISDVSSRDRLRRAPADGAVCGMIAAREHARQVWVAPANEPLQGVLGLVPTFSTDDWADLFDLQFNLIRPEPKDFRTMSAHTLSDERTLLQVSVRRLMILLRKAVLDRGMDFVFETNHERFREGVRVAFLNLLRFMFDRGAFSGPTPETSYRVVTDASVNPPQSVEQGRFVAQIQVAPSQPMEFITVLLTRTGEGLLQAMEA